MSYDALFDRRAFLATAGAATVVGVIGVAPAEAEPAAEIRTESELAIMHQTRAEPSGFYTSRPSESVRYLRPDDDRVRFWAREVAPRIGPETSVSGLTTWSDYIVFAGLAREAGLKRVREESAALDGFPPLIVWRFA